MDIKKARGRAKPTMPAKAPDPVSIAAVNPSYRLPGGQFDRSGSFMKKVSDFMKLYPLLLT
jgi:hypothetical protein